MENERFERLLDRLVALTQEQAKSATASVELGRTTGSVLSAMEGTLRSMQTALELLSVQVESAAERHDKGREQSVAEIKSYLDLHLSRGQSPRLVGWILGAASTIIAAALTALAVSRTLHS